jgi:SAM-dependent methyltransferase
MQQLLPQWFGYHLVQIGCAGRGRLLESSRIAHRCMLGPRAAGCAMPFYQGYAEPAALPFAADSLDVVVLAHVLEFETNPHQVLREVERMLIPEGHLAITGFNPFSLWGARRWGGGKAPWNGKFVSLGRLKDWLALLGFELITQKTVCFAPPLQQEAWLKRLDFMENAGQRWWPYFGGAYVLAARKRRIALTPIRPIWRKAEALVGGAVAPTARTPSSGETV